MTDKEIVQALARLRVETAPTYACLGCGREHNCSTQGCAILRTAADRIECMSAENAALREKVPQWISVEDRLPEAWKNEEDNTLINYMIYSPYFGVDIGNYHKEAGTWLCMALPCTVTHWMPLPEAPEEGDKA